MRAMTSSRESSRDNSTRISRLDIESLAGVFHPHAIEIQEFSYYALIIDIRPQADFVDDHIPGAVPLGGHQWYDFLSDGGTAGRPRNAEVGVRMSMEFKILLASVELDTAILVYDGCGDIGSKQLARALRWHGWTVDVLAGGWINYRRWVQAGLEALPRLISFRVVDTWLEGEARRVLNALAAVGEQVLDLASLAGRRFNASQELLASPPAQNWFDSQLVSALRGFDPHRVVWVADVGHQVELVRLSCGCDRFGLVNGACVSRFRATSLLA